MRRCGVALSPVLPVVLMLAAGCGRLRETATSADAGVDGQTDVVGGGDGPAGSAESTPPAPDLLGDAGAGADDAADAAGTGGETSGSTEGGVPEVAPAAPPGLAKCTELDHAGPRAACNLTTGAGDFAVYSVAFSPDGSLAATAGSDGRIKLWKVTGTGFEADGRELTAMSQARIAFSPDGKLLAAGGNAGDLFLYELETRNKVPLPGHADRLRGVAFNQAGDRLVTVDRAGVLKSWDVSGRRVLTSEALFQGAAEPWALAITRAQATGIWVAVGLGKATAPAPATGLRVPADGAQVWFGNLANTAQAVFLKADANQVEAVAISPDDRHLLAGGSQSEVGVWQLVPLTAPVRVGTIPPVKNPLNDNLYPVTGLAFRADGRYLAASHGGYGLGGALRIIEAPTFTVLHERLHQIDYFPVAVALRPAGDVLLAGEVGCGGVAVCRD